MCKEQNAVILADDVELVAEPNGDPMIYWTGQLSSFAGASALLVSVEILKVSGTLALRVMGQYGCDRTSWYPLGPSGYIDGTSAGHVAATVTPSLYVFTCNPSLLANQVRLGIKVSGTGSARATISVRPMRMPAEELASTSSAVSGAGDTVILPEMDVYGYDNAQIYISLDGTATGTMAVAAYGAARLGGYQAVLGSVNISIGADGAFLALTQLPRTLEIRTSGTAAPGAGNLVTTEVVLKAAA